MICRPSGRAAAAPRLSAQGHPAAPVEQWHRPRLPPPAGLLARLRLPLFLAVDRGHVSLNHILFSHQIGDVVADAEARCVRIREQDQAVFLRQRFQQLLAFFVLVDAKAICQQDHGIGQVGKAGGIVFALHNEHPAWYGSFIFSFIVRSPPLPTGTALFPAGSGHR